MTRREWSTLYNKKKTESVNHRCVYLSKFYAFKTATVDMRWCPALLLLVVNGCLNNISCEDTVISSNKTDVTSGS